MKNIELKVWVATLLREYICAISANTDNSFHLSKISAKYVTLHIFWQIVEFHISKISAKYVTLPTFRQIPIFHFT